MSLYRDSEDSHYQPNPKLTLGELASLQVAEVSKIEPS